MDDATEMHAPATMENGGAHVTETEPSTAVVVVHEAAPEPGAEPAPEPVPEPAHEDAHETVQKIMLDDYCTAKSKRLHGHIELIAAFGALERAAHHLFDTVENFDEAFDALRARPAK